MQPTFCRCAANELLALFHRFIFRSQALTKKTLALATQNPFIRSKTPRHAFGVFWLKLLKTPLFWLARSVPIYIWG